MSLCVPLFKSSTREGCRRVMRNTLEKPRNGCASAISWDGVADRLTACICVFRYQMHVWEADMQTYKADLQDTPFLRN